MGMHAKTLARPNTVIVDHQKRSKTTPTWIIVTGKTEAMPAIEPARLAVKTLRAGAENQGWIQQILGGGIDLGVDHQCRPKPTGHRA